MRTALASIALGVVGIALLLLVASTAGPPDGYRRYSERGVHVYLPDDAQVRRHGLPDIVVSASDRQGDTVEVADVPVNRRSLAAFVRFTRTGIAQHQGQVTRDEPIDVDGADEARELRVDYPDAGFRATQVIARRGARFLTLIVADSLRGGGAIDTSTIVDSFYLD